MTSAETAAMLMKKSSTSLQQGPISSRHRTSRVLAHHELANELLEESKRKNRLKLTEPSKGDATDSEDSFIAKQSTTGRRTHSAPQIVRQPRTATIVRRKDRHIYSSSSSDSDNDDAKPRCRRASDTSSDEEDDLRRQRLIAKRQIGEAELVKPRARAATQTSISFSETRSVQPSTQKIQLRTERKESTDSGQSTSEDSETSSSDSSSESDDETDQIRAKPIFVPKHRRNLIQSEEQKWKVEEARLERDNDRYQHRKLESRAMLARQMTAVEATSDEDLNEESYGATNPMPDDADESDAETQKLERECWELRELERLLTVLSQEKERERGRLEFERRRQMTDEECLKEDVNAGRYNAPGQSRTGGKESMQRFYHRGSYYMDEDEFDSNDIRFKAAEYASAATGEDKLDKSQLPEVLQGKKFGSARQNTNSKV
jgi:microfibrillar-associated protein 1